jgi:AsmA protein
MKRLLMAVAGLVVAGGATLAGVYVALSPRFLMAEIEKAVAAATGRTPVIAGSPALSLWPELAVTVDGIRLDNPSGMNAGAFAEVGRLRLKVNAAALLKRTADIEQVTLVKPRLSLLIDNQGRVNWNMAAETPVAREVGAPVPTIYVEDGTASFRDQRTGQEASLENLDLALKLTSLQGPLELKGHADWRGERVELAAFIKSPQELAGAGSALDLNLSTPRLTLAFTGYGAVRNGAEVAGQIDLKAASIAEFAGFTGATTKSSVAGPLVVDGAVSLSHGLLALKKARLSIDGMKAAGDVSVDLTQPIARFSARLGIDRLEIDRYAPFGKQSGNESGEGVEAWSTTPIDFSALKAIDAAASLQVGELVYGGVIARDVAIETTLTRGVLDSKLRDIELFNGRASGQVVLNGARQTPTVQASFQGQNLDGHRLFKDYAGFEGIEGTTEIALALAAQGHNQSEMIASLRGSAAFSFSGGAIRGFDLASVANEISGKQRSGWQQRAEERTPFSFLKANFIVSDGVAENNDLQLLGPAVRMSGAGSVDLLRREVDFRIEPRLVADTQSAIQQASSGLPVIIKGPWGKPTIAPETRR